MRRSWLGLGLLAALLAVSLWAGQTMTAAHEPVAQDLTLAAQEAQAGRWPQAEAHLQDALRRWGRCRELRACLADHTPLEEVEALLAQLQIYAQEEEPPDFAATCAEAARKVTAISQAHALEWGNLF